MTWLNYFIHNQARHGSLDGGVGVLSFKCSFWKRLFDRNDRKPDIRCYIFARSTEQRGMGMCVRRSSHLLPTPVPWTAAAVEK